MLDLNSDNNVDIHKGDAIKTVQMVSDTMIKTVSRIENAIDPTNSSIFQNVLDRQNHLFKITCKDEGLDPKAKYAIKQWLKQEQRDHISVMRKDEAAFFIHFEAVSKEC